jgi:RNA polymerase sigma factor (sigma-70 family)
VTNEELVTQYQEAGADQRKPLLDQLYRQNLGGIKAIAKRYAFLESAEDLQQEAFFGLVEAADTYRPGEAAFFTYAKKVIARHLWRYLHDHTGLVNRSESQERLMLAYYEYDAAHRQRYGRPPMDGEIAAYLDITQNRARKIREAATFRIASLSEPIGNDPDGLLLMDVLPDPDDKIAQAEEDLQRDEQAALLWELVDKLEESKRDVILAKYKHQQPVIEACKAQGISYTTWASRERAALADLRKNRRLLSFLEWRSPYRGTGLQNYTNTGTSAPEYAVLEMYKSKSAEELLRQFYAIRGERFT